MVGHSARVVVDLARSPDDKLVAIDAHLTTDGALNMREKLLLKAAIERYVLQGLVMHELVNGQAVAASVQTSMIVALIRPSVSIGVGSKSSWETAALDLRPSQDRLDQVNAAVAADAAQAHSVLKPSMVDTVTLQP